MLVALIRIGLFLIPWLTVFFIPKEEFKKYTPVATFATLLVLAESVLSGPFKWWKVKGGPLQKALNDFSFIFGPFFIGTIWIFRFTYGKFWLYLLANILMIHFLPTLQAGCFKNYMFSNWFVSSQNTFSLRLCLMQFLFIFTKCI